MLLPDTRQIRFRAAMHGTRGLRGRPAPVMRFERAWLVGRAQTTGSLPRQHARCESCTPGRYGAIVRPGIRRIRTGRTLNSREPANTSRVARGPDVPGVSLVEKVRHGARLSSALRAGGVWNSWQADWAAHGAARRGTNTEGSGLMHQLGCE